MRLAVDEQRMQRENRRAAGIYEQGVRSRVIRSSSDLMREPGDRGTQERLARRTSSAS
jgi:hypothetical protein